MNDLIPFHFDNLPIRVVMIEDAPWWLAADLAQPLGYARARDMVRLLDDDEQRAHIVRGFEGGRVVCRPQTVISESGLFAAILKSRKPEARRFRRWVTGEVLPALRRTGHYALPSSSPTPPVDHARYRLDLDAVALMRRLAGNGAALALWRHLALPLPESPAAGLTFDDGLAGALAVWIEGKDRFTYAEIGHGLGIGTPDYTTKRRIFEALTAKGWIYKNMKFGREQRWAWKSPRQEGAA